MHIHAQLRKMRELRSETDGYVAIAASLAADDTQSHPSKHE